MNKHLGKNLLLDQMTEMYKNVFYCRRVQNLNFERFLKYSILKCGSRLKFFCKYRRKIIFTRLLYFCYCVLKNALKFPMLRWDYISKLLLSDVTIWPTTVFSVQKLEENLQASVYNILIQDCKTI